MLRSALTLGFQSGLEFALCAGSGVPEGSQALVVPQDVELLLGECALVSEQRDPLDLADLLKVVGRGSRRLGSVLMSAARDRPLLFEAVVYDFARTPHAHEEHVFEALVTVLEETRLRSLRRLALQPLGTAHTGIAPALFLRLLLLACQGAAELGTSLTHVTLLLPSQPELLRYETLLRALFAQPTLER